MSQAKTIKEQIGFLKELQVIDREIYILSMEKEELPERIKRIEAKLETDKNAIKETQEKVKALQVALKDKEVNLQEKEDQIKKLQIQLYQLKSNKEYSAMLVEIEGVKADKALLEEEIIKAMDEIEISKKNITQEKEAFKNEELKIEKEKDDIRARGKEVDSRLSELSAEREKITPNIQKQVLARYEKVLKNRGGLAIVSVEHGACGGCHMNVPPQVASEAKLKEGIVTCGSCSRILYIDDNVEIN